MDELDKKIKEIEAIKETDDKVVKEARDPADIEEEFQKEVQRLEDAIYSLEDQIDSAEELFRHQTTDYKDQQELIEWIEFASEEKKIIKLENEKIEKIDRERKAEQ